MSSRIPSVKDTYFQHKVLTRLHGQPVYESLQTLLTELKANASSVPTTIGGGLYGHLGLILSDVRYATLPNTVPWVSPANPGPFVPSATTALNYIVKQQKSALSRKRDDSAKMRVENEIDQLDNLLRASV